MGKNRDWKFERDLRKDGSITVGGDVDYNVDPILKRGSTMEVERSIGKGLLSPLDEASPSKRFSLCGFLVQVFPSYLEAYAKGQILGVKSLREITSQELKGVFFPLAEGVSMSL
ncbi:hypothetical protein CK203_045756 [Vitis vinifera]|uniref:Uncharacterized protein n=1 Tax=Vitis vinifera TaxID=29760 RepID=A0A438I136_VITVI|nr:hypothetical protein CK203_045756 [Vitis vinifera]